MGLDYIEYLVELEREFEIKIPDEEATQFTTVGDAERYLSNQRPDLSDTQLRDRHLTVIAKVLTTEPGKIKAIESSTRFIEDLKFE